MPTRLSSRAEDGREFTEMGADGSFLDKLCDGARHCSHDGECLDSAVAAMNGAAGSLLSKLRASSGMGAEIALASFAWMLELYSSTSLTFVEQALSPVCGGCFHRGACRDAIGWGWMVENALKQCLRPDSGNRISFTAGEDEHGPYLQVSLVTREGEPSWIRYHADAETLAATREQIDPQRVLDILEPIGLRVAGRIGGKASHKALMHADVVRSRSLEAWSKFFNTLADLAAGQA